MVMKPIVGYRVYTKDGPIGETGEGYSYTLAGNGVWISAECPYLAARVPVARACIRGLAPLEPALILPHGKIPQHLFDLAISIMLTHRHQEYYVGFSWNGAYHLYVPEQEGSSGSVHYAVRDDVMMDLHSHGPIRTFFSRADNHDEQGFKLYGVLGSLNTVPEIWLRVGVYGSFLTIPWGDVFEGVLNGIKEHNEMEEIATDELQNTFPDAPKGRPCHSGWLWWYRWLRRRRTGKNGQLPDSVGRPR